MIFKLFLNTLDFFSEQTADLSAKYFRSNSGRMVPSTVVHAGHLNLHENQLPIDTSIIKSVIKRTRGRRKISACTIPLAKVTSSRWKSYEGAGDC